MDTKIRKVTAHKVGPGELVSKPFGQSKTSMPATTPRPTPRKSEYNTDQKHPKSEYNKDVRSGAPMPKHTEPILQIRKLRFKEIWDLPDVKARREPDWK